MLGDMTYGCAYWPAERNKVIGDEGYDDSKALSAEKREHFFECINRHADIGYVLRVISAEEISHSMLQVGAPFAGVRRRSPLSFCRRCGCSLLLMPSCRRQQR